MRPNRSSRTGDGVDRRGLLFPLSLNGLSAHVAVQLFLAFSSEPLLEGAE